MVSPRALRGSERKQGRAPTGKEWAAKAAREALTPGSQRVSRGPPVHAGALRPLPSRAPAPPSQLSALPGFTDALARPQEPVLPVLPVGTGTWGPQDLNEDRVRKQTPFPTAPSPRPPPRGRRHVTPPPALPAPPPRLLPRPASHPQWGRRRDDATGAAYSDGDAGELLGLRAEVCGVSFPEREGKVGCVEDGGVPKKDRRGRRDPEPCRPGAGVEGGVPHPLRARPDEAGGWPAVTEP